MNKVIERVLSQMAAGRAPLFFQEEGKETKIIDGVLYFKELDSENEWYKVKITKVRNTEGLE